MSARVDGAEELRSGPPHQMSAPESEHLRVLIANEKRERLELLARVVAGLGHEVIARETDVKDVGSATARERPDVALVDGPEQPPVLHISMSARCGGRSCLGHPISQSMPRMRVLEVGEKVGSGS
jgi:hypothetical protein